MFDFAEVVAGRGRINRVSACTSDSETFATWSDQYSAA